MPLRKSGETAMKQASRHPPRSGQESARSKFKFKITVRDRLMPHTYNFEELPGSIGWRDVLQDMDLKLDDAALYEMSLLETESPEKALELASF